MASPTGTVPSLHLSANGQAILAEVLRRPAHFSAEDLVRWGMDRSPRISRATVYRILPRLVAGGVLREVPLATAEMFYECRVTRAHHDHLVCTHCGRVIELESPPLEDLQDELCRTLEFRPSHHDLVIYGRCRDCR